MEGKCNKINLGVFISEQTNTALEEIISIKEKKGNLKKNTKFHI